MQRASCIAQAAPAGAAVRLSSGLPRKCTAFLAPNARQGSRKAAAAPAGAAAGAALSSSSSGGSTELRRRWGRCAAVEAEAAAPAAAPAPADAKAVPQADVWELDFCSRPILDERGKKVWELIICDADRTFEYATYYPNNKINSTEVSGEGWVLAS
jgi:hypothetical protein